ncbi:hypothetical protein KP509_17G080100 [Ceratopteris richardii]|uniref:DCD domain-containing protein n=1 Tax=Ceratopteris richardii TaxID=49495 RepID=A0A8T2SVW0_CERRI|nr:hypothetical protein KP509_17G080100 [Ceratopteris richardii]KAH7373932.1 hypothetical protein KP509_17G080100 [Ceratopteris richardii]KAH7373933.1 hypothetical protein KP509_17G080100 [Ceratopteris richardii]KAH7373934.1 hypothetical protein KP509_17G080100 [Ceratopteris richardii]KAH7373935.1 hypothetical protein KP509_17G080100 [Ceratopteris richardii]
MSGRMHPKQSRELERGSPGRRRPGSERGKVELFHRESPDRAKRGRWGSPPRSHMDSPGRMWKRDFESPSRAGRKDLLISPRSRRGGFEDGPNLSSDRHRHEEDYHIRPPMHQDIQGRDTKSPAGLVFLCSSSTFKECFHFRVFGLPAPQKEVVERVLPGTKLFLFNFDSKELFGVFEAVSRGGLNLVPEAFLDAKATYAAQVRFSIVSECLPLADEIVNDVLRDNFSQRGKFDCELSADQVFKLMQLFSRQMIRPGPPSQERERHLQDSRSLPFSMNRLDPDGRPFPSLLPGFEPQLPINRPHVDGGPIPDPAAILGPGMIEEADQVALKYLKDNPAIVGIRLEPVNISLLSSALRNNLPSGLLNASISRDHGAFPAFNLQLNGSQQGLPFPVPNPRLLGHPGGSVPDSVNLDRMEHLGADAGKMFGQFTPGSLGAVERGLLPVPPMHHHVPGMLPVNLHGVPSGLPNQPGMIRPFPPGGPFPSSAGPLAGIPPELGGPHVPPHPLQGPHGIPPHIGNPPQLGNPQMGIYPNDHLRRRPGKKWNKLKKNKQKKKSKQQKGAGGGSKDDKEDDNDKKDDDDKSDGVGEAELEGSVED